MAIALPVYVADGTLSTPRLPAYALDGTFVVGNIHLPQWTFGFRTLFVVPTVLMSPAYLNLTPTGGVKVGGYASIVGDPMVPQGGVLVGGTSPVTHWIAVAPTGGVKVGGSAVVSATIVNIYDIEVTDLMPRGGVEVGGGADIDELINHIPLGGVLVGGAGVVQEAINYIPAGGVRVGGSSPESSVASFIPTGGVIVSGASAIVVKYNETPFGGVLVGGAASVTMRVSLHVPSGGVQVGGSAVAYAIKSNSVVTTENPYADDFPGWSVNYDNGAASRYLGLPANSMTQFAGRTFVANAGGIYEVGADDDAGQEIRAAIEFPTTDYQDAHEKRAEVAYVGVKTQGRMRLKVKTNRQAPKYYVLMPNSTTPKGTRVPLGKGLLGRYWTYRLENIDGSDFDLESVEFNPVSQQRHGA